MKTNENTPIESAASALAFSPKDTRRHFEAAVEEAKEAGHLKTGKDAQCGKVLYSSLLIDVLIRLSILPPSHAQAAFEALDALPANASAMRQELEKWDESEAAASKKSAALLSKYGAKA